MLETVLILLFYLTLYTWQHHKNGSDTFVTTACYLLVVYSKNRIIWNHLLCAFIWYCCVAVKFLTRLMNLKIYWWFTASVYFNIVHCKIKKYKCIHYSYRFFISICGPNPNRILLLLNQLLVLLPLLLLQLIHYIAPYFENVSVFVIFYS